MEGTLELGTGDISPTCDGSDLEHRGTFADTFFEGTLSLDDCELSVGILVDVPNFLKEVQLMIDVDDAGVCEDGLDFGSLLVWVVGGEHCWRWFGWGLLLFFLVDKCVIFVVS